MSLPKGNRLLEHLLRAPKGFRQEVIQMDSTPISLDGPSHMALPDFRGLGSVGKLMARSELPVVFLIPGIWQPPNPLSLQGKEEKQALPY